MSRLFAPKPFERFKQMGEGGAACGALWAEIALTAEYLKGRRKAALGDLPTGLLIFDF